MRGNKLLDPWVKRGRKEFVFFFLSFVYVREMRDIKGWGGGWPAEGEFSLFLFISFFLNKNEMK
jgi:hypothetical protein